MLDKNVDKGISAANIVDAVRKNGHNNAYFLDTRENVHKFILENAKDGDCVVIMAPATTRCPTSAGQLLTEL